MPWYDMPLERLREYRTSTPEPEGLDGWWKQRLDRARAQARPAVFTPYEPDVYRPFEVFDVECFDAAAVENADTHRYVLGVFLSLVRGDHHLGEGCSAIVGRSCGSGFGLGCIDLAGDRGGGEQSADDEE